MHAFLRSRLVQSQAHLKMYINKNRDRDTAKANLIAVAVIPMLRSLLKTGKLNKPSLLSSHASAPGCSICLNPHSVLIQSNMSHHSCRWTETIRMCISPGGSLHTSCLSLF